MSHQTVREHLSRVIGSVGFTAHPRASAFLSHVVERTLAGRAAEIKEATIGVEVFGRQPGYDTKSDPIVRSTARALREKLNDYYLAHPHGGVRIELPKGTYVPVFHESLAAGPEDSAGAGPAGGADEIPTAAPVPIRWIRALALSAALAALAIVLGMAAYRRPAVVDRGDAAVLYRQGHEKLLAGDYTGARPLLERAARLAPDRAPVHALLADDLRLLGYDSLALAEARQAEVGTAGLSPSEALQVEASFRAASGDYQGAVETLSRLRQLEPNRQEHTREIARAEMSAADFPACLHDIVQAGAAAEDAQFRLIESFCRAGAGDYRAALEPARRAAELAKQNGVPGIYARARLLESGLLMSTGYIPESRPLREEARRICESIGDRSCVLRALRVQANLDLQTTGAAAALEEYRRALPLARELGSAGEVVNLLSGEGLALTSLDDFSGANAALVEALVTAQRAGMNLSALRLNVSELALEEGQLSRADVLAGEAADAARRDGDENTEAQAQAIRSKALLLGGDLRGSERCLNQSPGRSRGHKLPNATLAIWLLSSAALNRVAGRLDAAGRQLDEVQSIGEPGVAIRLAIEQTELLLDRRDYDAAQRRAREALADRGRIGVSESAQIGALLSDAYGWSGRPEEARQALAAARARITDHSATLARIQVLISSGRWSAGEPEASRSIQEAIDLARRSGFRLAEDEARLVRSQREQGGLREPDSARDRISARL